MTAVTDSSLHKSQMRHSIFGRLVARLYGRLPLRTMCLWLAVRSEGGELYSLSLRAILSQHYGVHLGNYSYGSLCAPGMADTATSIGPYVSIGPGVRRLGAAHPLTDVSMHPFWYNPGLGLVGAGADVERSACVIEAEAWLGTNAIILPGCQRIGFGAVVGAGSIVTKDVEDFAIVVGNPARKIGTRLSAAVQAELLARQPWTLHPKRAKMVLDEIMADVEQR